MAKPFPLRVLWIVAVWNLALTCYGQVKPRVAVFPFDDRTSSTKDMNIGAKVADQLIAKLAGNSAFTVFDRQYVDRLLAEKNLKYDPNYDSAGAAKSGLMGTVDLVISGQIDAFNASSTDVMSNKVVVKTHEIDGTVILKVTARVISVEKGSILLAPTASNEEKGVLAKTTNYSKSLTGHLVPKDSMGFDSQTATDIEKGLRKLVDDATVEVAKSLSTEISPVAASTPAIKKVEPPNPVKAETKSPSAKLVGISDGLSYIDKGSSSGVKVGDKFTVRRNSDTGLKDDSGAPILRHKAVCSLVVTSLEDSSSAGKCVAAPGAQGTAGIPHKGDEAVPSN